MVKGAPERVIAQCSSIYFQNKIQPITKVEIILKEISKELEDLNIELSSRGERILAFAQTELESQYDENY